MKNKFTYYTCNNSTRGLYVSICSNTPYNCTSLLQQRGPKFKLTQQLLHLQQQQSQTTANIIQQIDQHYNNNITINDMGEDDDGIIFAGIGDPLLYISSITKITNEVKQSRHGVPFRIITTGLISENDATYNDLQLKPQILIENGIKNISIILPSADPFKYIKLIHPDGIPSHNHPKNHHNLQSAAEFITNCVESGLNTTIMTIDRGSEISGSIRDIRALSSSLGALDVIVKSYHD